MGSPSRELEASEFLESMPRFGSDVIEGKVYPGGDCFSGLFAVFVVMYMSLL
jgi:hypothetical protein